MIPYEDNSLYKTSVLDEAIAYAEEKGKYEKVPLIKSHFFLDPDGTLKIQKTPFKITEGGILNLCATLGIPDPFAEMIPTDLFITNVNRLIAEDPQGRVNAYFDYKDNLVDFNKKLNLQPIDTADILKEISVMNNHSNLRAFFENHIAKMELVPESQKELIESKGEIHKTGYMIYHYPTAKSVTQALGLIWTVACANGALVSRELWREKLNLKSTSDAPSIIKKFFDKLKGSLFLSPDSIREKIDIMKNTNFLLDDFRGIYNSVKRAVNDDVDTALTPGAVMSYLDSKDKDPEFELDINKYKVYYALTDYASNLTKSATISKKLQLKAGSLLLEQV